MTRPGKKQAGESFRAGSRCPYSALLLLQLIVSSFFFFLLAWKVRVEARAKVRAIPKWLLSFLSPLSIDCEQREQGGGC